MAFKLVLTFANVVTAFRIVLCIPLIASPVFSGGFFAAYLLCGVSDMVDGPIARKTRTASAFGSRFDTVADACFLAASAVKVLPAIVLPIWMWVWIGAIAIVKVAGIARSFRSGVSPLPHSIPSKVAGLFLFLFVLFLPFFEAWVPAVPVCVAASIAALWDWLPQRVEK